jgi:hypothetical protein
MERLLNAVIDVWAAKAEHLPVSWILEECKRRTRSARLTMPSRRAIDARLRDRGIDGLSRRQFVHKQVAAVTLTPRSRNAVVRGLAAVFALPSLLIDRLRVAPPSLDTLIVPQTGSLAINAGPEPIPPGTASAIAMAVQRPVDRSPMPSTFVNNSH